MLPKLVNIVTVETMIDKLNIVVENNHSSNEL